MLWLCVACTTAYSVGAPRCPQCGSTEHVEEGAEMPKVTVHGGPTNRYLVGETGPEQLPTTAGGEVLPVEDVLPVPSGDPQTGVPDGTAKDVLDWVGDDPAKAARALIVEQAREKPRTTLLAELEKRTA